MCKKSSRASDNTVVVISEFYCSYHCCSCIFFSVVACNKEDFFTFSDNIIYSVNVSSPVNVSLCYKPLTIYHLQRIVCLGLFSKW